MEITARLFILDFNLIMKKIYYIFVCVVLLIFICPGMFTNTKSNQKSAIDNRMLAEFPTDCQNDWNEAVENYLEDRVGFRNMFITGYQISMDKLFHIFARAGYSYGRNGEIYSVEDSATYQHREVEDEYITLLADYLEGTQSICDELGASLYFFVAPNKETILYEDYPLGYNVRHQPNRTDRIYSALKDADIKTIDVRYDFLEMEEKRKLFNVKYDPAHWNGLGHYSAMNIINAVISQEYPELDNLSIELFDVNTKTEQYFNESFFPIHEEVPTFSLKKDDTVQDNSLFEYTSPLNYALHWNNPKGRNLPKIMFIGDSYLGTGFGTEICFKTRCSEFTRIHIQNIADIPFYISYYKPDIVVIEAVERVFGEKSFWSSAKLQSGFNPHGKSIMNTYSIEDMGMIKWSVIMGTETNRNITILEGEIPDGTNRIEAVVCEYKGELFYAKVDKSTGGYCFAFPFSGISADEIKFDIYYSDSNT